MPAPVLAYVRSHWPTLIRAVEGFAVILAVGVASDMTIGGQAVNLATPDGRSAAMTALVGSAILAARRAFAHRQATGRGPW
jgi:hypothetical protein